MKNFKKIEKYLKTDKAKEELKRIASKPLLELPKPTWEQLNTPMDI